MKVKIKRLKADGITTHLVDAWTRVDPGRDIRRMGSQTYYPVYSAPDGGQYFGYYEEEELVKEKSPTEVNQWGPVIP